MFLYKGSDEMAKEISAAEDSARSGNYELAQQQIDTFIKDWDAHKKVYATFIRHAEIDLANQSASKLKAYLDDDNKSNFFGECEALKMQINHIADTERFTFYNIL
jgi:hypothetical protein